VERIAKAPLTARPLRATAGMESALLGKRRVPRGSFDRQRLNQSLDRSVAEERD